ncbi:MAG: DinB family protein [Chitinophagaceae bacterium]|nr:DinB family protein [Chitinophagaceae bacterium]
MITTTLILLYQKELDKLKDEINAYEAEEQLWKVGEGIANSGGNLCLHLAGNLQHYIGAILGESGYIRNREAEFKIKNMPRERLLEEISNTKAAVIDTLEQLSKKDLDKDYPVQVFGEPMNTEYFLLHLLHHLGYHTGQINYHRRLVK